MSNNSELTEIKNVVTLNANQDKVWDAVATAEGITAWWMPNDFEPVEGKAFTLHAGEFGDSPCKVTKIKPKTMVSFDWGKDWNLTFKLKAIDDHTTEFTLIHSGWDDNKETEFGQPHSVVQGFMDDGWDEIVNTHLVNYVTS
ncbi:SRPBCC family protein [Staphylococcus arlettae]|uniref:SRPBCC family protein n=1 Tax=Staphylococcus arlettae TaxID=29378 RepID=UPI00186B9807|nr:SRPBCC domain-containing protein [Staphylococcus arlettae]QZZ03627.1 SRPBCC domain-containing protein [Staphylococcus arlettae]